MPAAIRTEALAKVYLSGFFRRPFVGLKGLDMEVPEGTTFGFVGPNGAGKTTTIKMLMGLQSATSGRAWIFDTDFRDPASRKRVGFMPERPYFYEHLTAGEFLDFYARLTEVAEADRPGRITGLLERVGLDRFRNVPLGKFSKGMLQRAGIAQALINDPDLVVLDEPMSGLDPLGRVLVRDIIEEEHRKGKTVFFSSHILSDVESLCDRVAIVVASELRGIGTVTELLGQAVNEVDIRARHGGPLPGRVVRADGGEITVRVRRETVDSVIDAIRSGGGSVLSVHPLTRSLEDVLLTEVERARQVNEARLGVLT